MDFAERYHLRLRQYLPTSSWNETWELVRPLLSDPYSHVAADALGWTRPPHAVEESTLTLFDLYRQVNRKKNAAAIKPIDRPWRTPRNGPSRQARSDAEKAAGRSKLMDRLGMGSDPE